MIIHKKLEHLSAEQLDDLSVRYQRGDERVADLVRDFEIDITPSKLISILPPINHKDLFCPYCIDTNLISKRQGREASLRWPQIEYCPKCEHKNTENCRCQSCKEKADILRRETEEIKQQIIEMEYPRAIEILSSENISLRDAVFILALTRHFITEDMKFAEPFNKNEILFAPCFEFQNDIVKHLYSKGFLAISPKSPVDAFVFDPNITRIDGYYPTKAIWEFLPGLDVEEKRDYLKNLQFTVKGDKWPDGWREDVPILWREISKYECLEYFHYLLEQRDFRIDKVGEKTHATFENLLEDFSVSVVFNLSFMAVRDTTDYIVRENISHGHGKNIFIGAIQRKAERAKAEGWELRHSRRDFNCPQSVVSSTFFNLFLGIGDVALETIAPEIL